MSTTTESKPWDFSHALDLINSLSAKDNGPDNEGYDSGYTSAKSADVANGVASQDIGTPQSQRLGDFSKIWQFLGTPHESPVPDVPTLTREPGPVKDGFLRKIDYTSDGATYVRPSTAVKSKGVTFADETSAEEAATDTLTDRSASPETPTMTKTQRKKARRKERKAKDAAEALKSATVSESEADSIKRKTPARKASAHTVVPASEPIQRYQLRPRDDAGQTARAPSLQPSIELAASRVAEKLAELKKSASPKQPKVQPSTPSRPQPPPTKRQNSQPTTSTPTAQRTVSAYNAVHHGQPHQSTVQQWPVTPSTARNTDLVPASVQPPSQPAASLISNSNAIAFNQNTTPSAKKPKNIIEPKIVRSGEDRHWALLMKLIGDFWEDRRHLISPMNLTTHNNDPNGIHVFVDASNIFIGFTDQLKRSRGIPPYVQVPQVDLSFDGLALLMERRRPVCKRVLVGSTPNLPAFDKAKAVGYECSILEKVYKARELTERQIFFGTHDRFGRPIPGKVASKGAPPASNSLATVYGSPKNNTGALSSTSNGGSGNGSETGPQYAPAKMIEQGVDEILHLKILESVVDSETPSTIVLATGDAAQAEYSAGFMAMVERALKKGWTVELVSWSKNINQMYLKAQWMQAWGERFRVVYLDDYAEELLEM